MIALQQTHDPNKASTCDRWRRVLEVVQEALLIAPGEGRQHFIDAACSGAPLIRQAVQELLNADDEVSDFLEHPPITVQMVGLPADKPPNRIGPYRVLSEIGRGGMSRVYLAVHATQRSRSRIALKTLRREIDALVTSEAIWQEGRILDELRHPNIARLVEEGKDLDGSPYIAMEFVDGIPIHSFCFENQVSVRERLALFCTVCDAVGYAHGRNIVHHDLKPTNILVTEDGVPKLLDFGIAKLYAPGSDALPATFRFFTPEYASPEQLSGRPTSPASDVFALGVLLFLLLTGRLPFAGWRGRESFNTSDHLEGPATIPRRLADALGNEVARLLGEVVLTALAMVPHERYSSASTLANEVRHCFG